MTTKNVATCTSTFLTDIYDHILQWTPLCNSNIFLLNIWLGTMVTALQSVTNRKKVFVVK